MHVTLSRSELPRSDEAQLLYLLVELPTGDAAPTPLPLNLCLLIDRSSSMRGERLTRAKEAASLMVERLGQLDTFSLVTFNDRPEVTIAAQRVVDRAALQRAISQIGPAGGTELAAGMAGAAQELLRPVTDGVGRMILLTDGRTYGDEDRCVEIARYLQARGIGLTALGLGYEWNEDLLETLAAGTNSKAQYLTSSDQILGVFGDEIKRAQSIVARGVRLAIDVRPGATIRSLDRVRPFIAPVTLDGARDSRASAELGDFTAHESPALLLELVVPGGLGGEQALLRLTLAYQHAGAEQHAEAIVSVFFGDERIPVAVIAPQVKGWLERLVAYRLQAVAWKNVETGLLDQASQRLKMASTRLFSVGQIELARTVEEEARRLERAGSVSEEGRKRIRFGTRGLIDRGGDEP